MNSLALALALAAQPAVDLTPILSDPRLEGGIPAVIVTDVVGNVLFEKNADIRVMPASNQKVLVCAFALSEFGASYRPETRFWTIDGDVVVDAIGDPSMTGADLDLARASLRPKRGAKVLIRPAFLLDYPPSWEIDDTPFRYAPKIRALTYNRSAVEIFAGPKGIEPFDTAAGIRVVRGDPQGELSASFDLARRTVTVAGAWPKTRSRAALVPMPDPTSASAKRLGGTPFTVDVVPQSPPDYSHRGPEMRQLIKDCLEPSDNMMAEHLLLMAAAKRVGPLGSSPYAEATTAMSKWYQQVVGGRPNEVRPYDGSGMSRHNLITARAMARTLQWIRQQGFAEDFRIGLPSPGEGTMRTRLAGSPVAAKTGTIDLVSSLSGYVGNGERMLIFSVIFNHAPASSAAMREIQDRIVLELVKHVGSEKELVLFPSHQEMDADAGDGRPLGYRIR